MIKLIVWVLLFLAAIAIVPFLIGEKGYILIAMGDITIESSVVTAVIMLVSLFIALMFTLKVVRGGFSFSLGAWNKFAFRNRRRGQRELNKGIAAYLLGDYQQAEHLLVKSAEPSQQTQIAYLVAANAAQKQNRNANTDHYLQLIEHQEKSLKDIGLESVLVNINLLISRQEFDKARALIDEHHRHIGHDQRLLALEIDLCIAQQHYEKAVEWLNTARKNKHISDDKIQHWENVAFKGYFSHLIKDGALPQLLQGWQNLPRKVKQRDNVILIYCQVLAERNIIEPLHKLLLPVVKKGTDQQFIHAIKQLPIQQPNDFIVAVEKHLHKSANNTDWLSCLGHFAYMGQDYALAEKAFNSLAQHLATPLEKLDVTVFADVLIKQNKNEQAATLLLNYHQQD